MIDRIEYNKKILALLTEFLCKNPTFRFTQALWALGIIRKDNEGNIVDNFYEEPSDTLSIIVNRDLYSSN